MRTFSEGFAAKLAGDSFLPVVFCRYDLVTYEPGETPGTGTRTVTPFYWSERAITYDAQAYEGRIAKVTSLNQILDQSNQAFGEMGLQISNYPTNLAGIIQSGMRVTVYYGFEDSVGSGTVTDAEIIFVGVVSGEIEITEDSLSFEMIDVAHTYDRQVPAPITRRKFPLADPDAIGDTMPIVFGRVKNLECKPVYSGFASSLAEEVTAVKPAEYQGRFVDQDYIYISDDPTWYIEFLMRKGIARVENPSDSEDVRQFVIGDDVNYGPHVFIGNSIGTGYSARIRAFEYDTLKAMWKVFLWPVEVGQIAQTDENYSEIPLYFDNYLLFPLPDGLYQLGQRFCLTARCSSNRIRWYMLDNEDDELTQDKIVKEETLTNIGDVSCFEIDNEDYFDKYLQPVSICTEGSVTYNSAKLGQLNCSVFVDDREDATRPLLVGDTLSICTAYDNFSRVEWYSVKTIDSEEVIEPIGSNLIQYSKFSSLEITQDHVDGIIRAIVTGSGGSEVTTVDSEFIPDFTKDGYEMTSSSCGAGYFYRSNYVSRIAGEILQVNKTILYDIGDSDAANLTIRLECAGTGRASVSLSGAASGGASVSFSELSAQTVTETVSVGEGGFITLTINAYFSASEFFLYKSNGGVYAFMDLKITCSKD